MGLRKKYNISTSFKNKSVEILLLDEKGFAHGEYEDYVDDKLYKKGFLRKDFFIGKALVEGKNIYFSFFLNEKNTTAPMKISEAEHKKELVMIRLGLIEEPIELSFMLKDYDENGKIK